MNLCNILEKFTLKNIDIVSATCGPGLIGGVIVGSLVGRTIASILNKPFIAVNHLEGHALTAVMTNNISFPFLLLLASGGHTQFIIVEGFGKYKIIGETIDDAIGEAFDKVAKMLDMDFPGGKHVEKYALEGDEKRFNFPKPIYHQKNCDFSFSGLKTAVYTEIKKLIKEKYNNKNYTENEKGIVTIQDKKDICASFQYIVSEIIIKKTKNAVNIYEDILLKKNTNDINHNSLPKQLKKIVISGGVASNKYLRNKLSKQFKDIMGYNLIAPPITLCTDNAAMIAFAGFSRFKNGITNTRSFKTRSNWRLEEVCY
ncbi:MAG TPA: tRNA (adenosine(37)-N6)-threonylcarbamoyltransferase complex transferase subunit TsaD [Candidatus Megaira endosymbiont of Hartmannula sinica]|nr:tRNA (adenosine(37)-N6)-threonylcarbamoyltransferase complex transferase subunit TsaD [Candidatus Megaera endosymbiont of Hartmannula sinica]